MIIWYSKIINSLSMMYFLATLIFVFLFTTAAALPSSISEEFNLASLPSMDSSFSDFPPSSAAAADEPNFNLGQSLNFLEPSTLSSQNANLDQSLNFLEPSTLSSHYSNLDQSLNFLEPLTLSSQPAQLPGANSDETTTIDPSTTSTTGQTDADVSINICHADGSTGQDVQKREDICRDELYFLLRPESPRTNYAAPTGNDLKNKKRADDDKKWVENFASPDISPEERSNLYLPLAKPGEDWCRKRWEAGPGNRARFEWALCCLGPKEFITIPTLRFKRVRRSVTLVNVFNCLLFLSGRPFCAVPEERYCCHEVGTPISRWGFKGLDCVEMGWDNYPTVPVRLQAQ